MNNSFRQKTHIPVELLADYEQGLVDQATRQEIEIHLQACEQCSTTLAGIQHYLDAHGAEALDAYLEKPQQSMFNGHKSTWEDGMHPAGEVEKRSAFARTWWKVAAAILVLVIPALLVWKQSSRESTETLVAQHLQEPFPWGSVGRGNNAAALEGDTVHARFAYRSGNYEMALSIIDRRIAAGKGNPDDPFYRGLCYLYMSPPNAAEAIASFDQVIQEGERFQDQAAWYRALALAKTGSDIEAREALKAIARNPRHYKNEDAARLLSTYPKE